MAYQFATYEKKGKVAYVTLNRPQVYNALHPPAHRELWDIWCDFRDDPDLWVAILTGAGDKAFCAGNDLKYTAEHPEMFHDPLPPGGFGGITDRFECWKPIIAAVNGFALGGGLEIALACDIIVAAEHARLGLPEPTVGLMAGAGGVHRLPRHLPLKLAMGMLVTGRHVPALEAHRMGLVNEVVPYAELMAAAERWAEDVLKCAPLSVQATKQAAMQGLDSTLQVALDRRYPAVQALMRSEDWIEGPRAFAEKRKPNWKGR